MRPKSTKTPTPKLGDEAMVLTHECFRCGEKHNGARLAPGWTENPLLCSYCADRSHLEAVTGTEPRKAA